MKVTIDGDVGDCLLELQAALSKVSSINDLVLPPGIEGLMLPTTTRYREGIICNLLIM